MPYPVLTHRDHHRQASIARRLHTLLASLDHIDRRAPLPPATAGAARRTLSEASSLLGTRHVVPAGTRNPGDLFVGTIANLHALQRLYRLQDKAFHARPGQTYPRRSGEE